MPLYDFYCDNCEILKEDEYFKFSDEKTLVCSECQSKMRQVFLSAPGLSDPGGVGNKWTNDGYQMRDEKSNNLRNITKKYEKGKRVI
tara:strand:- start:3409 stop:3669 length:261 start_codon:yes stop_codon:yes gene_type:complete